MLLGVGPKRYWNGTSDICSVISEVWILVAENGLVLAHTASFLGHDNPSFAWKRLRLVDYQALDGSTTLLVPMLSWALDKCRNEGVHMLETIGFRPDKRNVITIFANPDASPNLRRIL